MRRLPSKRLLYSSGFRGNNIAYSLNIRDDHDESWEFALIGPINLG